MARFTKKYFKGKVANLCQSIADKLTEQKDLQEKVENKKAEFESKDYNSNVYREIIPVLKNTDYRLAKDMLKERKEIEKEISKMEKELEKIEGKQKNIEETIKNYAIHPVYSNYQVTYNAVTNSIILFNAEMNEKSLNGETQKLNSIFVFDEKNNVKGYKDTDELFNKNMRFNSLTNPHSNYNYSVKDFIDDCKKGEILYDNKGIDVINKMYNTIAEGLENGIDFKKQKSENLSIERKMEQFANRHNKDMLFNPEEKQVMFVHPTGYKIVANVDAYGMIDAHYLDNKNNSMRIYDFRDSSMGMLNVNDKAFKEIINTASFKEFMSDMVGIDIQTDKTKSHQYTDKDTTFIGNKEYSMTDVGIKEIQNSAFSYSNSSFKLTKEMLSVAETYKKSVPNDVDVQYNPYNNTINLIGRGAVVSLAFDEKAKLQDVYCKRETDRISDNDRVIYQGEILNDKMLKNPTFKYITRNLAFDEKSILQGKAGEIVRTEVQKEKVSVIDKIKDKIAKKDSKETKEQESIEQD